MTILDLADSCRPRLSHSEAKRIAFVALRKLRSVPWQIYQLEPVEIAKLRPLFAEASRAKGPELPGLALEPAPRVFQFDRWRVRIFERDFAPWFVGKDVCEALGIANNRDAISRLDKDERATVGISDTSSNGVIQERQLLIISESGLYALILRCQGATTEGTPAHTFRRWVTSEVLPKLRREGTYTTVSPDNAPERPPKAAKAPAVRLPSGAQLHELRLLAEKGTLGANDIRQVLGIPMVIVGRQPEEPKASLELGEEAFRAIRDRFGLKDEVSSGALG
jgi:prophage antirepressor-like protein